MVDPCAAEFAAQTPYFYSTYEQENEAEPLPGTKAVVLGSGPIRIGQGIEFDYCSVRAAQELRRGGTRRIMINSNPEPVSTNFDMSDRLYFEPLDAESVLNILENEAPPALDTTAPEHEATQSADAAGAADAASGAAAQLNGDALAPFSPSASSASSVGSSWAFPPVVVQFCGRDPIVLAEPA